MSSAVGSFFSGSDTEGAGTERLLSTVPTSERIVNNSSKSFESTGINLGVNPSNFSLIKASIFDLLTAFPLLRITQKSLCLLSTGIKPDDFIRFNSKFLAYSFFILLFSLSS